MAKDNVMDFNLEDFDFASLASDVFGDMTTTNKISTENDSIVYYATYSTTDSDEVFDKMNIILVYKYFNFSIFKYKK